MDVMVPRISGEKSEAGEQQWRRESTELRFFYTHTQLAFMLIQDFSCFNSHKAKESPCSPKRPGYRDVAPQKSLRSKTNFYLKVNTGSTEFFALTLLSFTLSPWNEEKR